MKIPGAFLALAAAACAHQPASNEQALSLAAAETAFAAHSVREDMRAAFLAHFAPDGVTVRNGWVVSNDFLRDRPAPPIVLDWRPAYTEVAASGELGLSTGPVKITSKAKPDAPPSFAQYVSVWRREDGGPWRVEVDLGIGHEAPSLWDRPLEARMAPVAAATGAGGSLAEAEARFAADSLAHGMRAAYAAQGSPAMRFYRNDFGPVIGHAAALASGGMSDARLVWTPAASRTARSGDLGYARGQYAAAASPSVPLGWYLRVWHREGDGWRIVIDVANPAS
jgi:ketosteroid isomerase-like protein